MSFVDPEAARMLIGAPKPIPALLVSNEEDGKQYIVQRVAVMLIADDLTAKIAATVALAVAQEILGALEDAGVAPPGTLQKYKSNVESEGDVPGPTKEPPEAPHPDETRIPEEP